MVDRKNPLLLPATLSRRNALRSLGAAIAVIPLGSVVGCSSDDGTIDGLTSPTPPPNDTAVDPGGSTVDAGPPAAGSDGGLPEAVDAGTESADGAAQEDGTESDSDEETAITPSGEWASGGTAALSAAGTYPNPFEESATEATCALTCALTLGPCHDDTAPSREDISEGKPGLPLRLGFRIVDTDCNPITDANVDIWHCDTAGVYSSDRADSPAFCTGDNDAALDAQFFRGHQPTDSDGIAWFNTCFPGWYAGRAIHIHLTVRRSTRDGNEYVTSQMAFPMDLVEEICTGHPDYAAHGSPDTPNTADSIFPANIDNYLLAYQQMSDGAMLAYKTIVIRSSLDTELCGATEGFTGGGGFGGRFPGNP